MARVHSNTTFLPNTAPFVTTYGAVTEVDMDEPVVYIQELYAADRAGDEHR